MIRCWINRYCQDVLLIVGLGLGLMSPVLGMCTSMAIGLINGGPLTIMLGFLISGVCIWFSLLSLGEIVSKFP